MTPQEFFKNDHFAGKVGIELIEVRPGYSKAQVTIGPQHLNAGHRTQGGVLFTLADLPIRTGHWLCHCRQPLLSCGQAARATR